ncbi:uncharacterized protein LAESUDRAFT_716933 [Laetiporus sulphureus 93-53]|uniref:Uncharacterized protein n=1 Tax=Laetiporus sulphureus 93-53 TaxID=1314785 RepID=A0A165C7A1_9APHY|nr:uncharacterized protein LAESUDRAFT_716933 [Laetiporus sulphureus 93-53]KZT02325.1 hypothetical protein LAESUDRAFT_716933 [Laetiporus sulphureus 93-53]
MYQNTRVHTVMCFTVSRDASYNALPATAMHQTEDLCELLEPDKNGGDNSEDEHSPLESSTRNGGPGTSSDDESIATDASDSQDEDDLSFTLPNRRHIASAGVDQQAVARVFFELERAAPKMQELSQYLSNVPALIRTEDVERAAGFQDKLLMLTRQLSRLLISHDHRIDSLQVATPGALDSMLQDRPKTPLPTQCKRRAGTDSLLGASPEKTQRRKDSHAPH